MRSAQAFGASFVFTIGRRYDRQAGDTTAASRHLPIFHLAHVDELRDRIPIHCRIIGIENIPSARSLTKFVHPCQALYLLGAEDHGLTKEALETCDDVVQIPQPAFCLNVATAGSIVMYDRVSKGDTWQSRSTS